MTAGLQALLRRAFMAAEALFNRAFGDRLNPLYHLGSLSFYLFWIVGGTGLYLYAFFDTSVAGAYRSMQALTQDQAWAGGLLRSVHRYASDAMVVTMLIHLLRHWAFDRIRGFRWFSWFTGVVLLWLVFAAGVNGYMLPWDRLAQFVTQASFEWLDWLPGFGGTLVRNFMLDQNVSDRLFSLLVFIHIGVPLLTLLLMWVHVQRVPKAVTQPPRPIAAQRRAHAARAGGGAAGAVAKADRPGWRWRRRCCPWTGSCWRCTRWSTPGRWARCGAWSWARPRCWRRPPGCRRAGAAAAKGIG